MNREQRNRERTTELGNKAFHNQRHSKRSHIPSPITTTSQSPPCKPHVLIQRNTQNNFHSKLTDFGFLPLLITSRKPCDQKLVAAKSPEYAQGKKLSRKADVYCFGVIILEIITGRIPGEISLVGNERTMEDLSEWVRTVVNNDWSTDILDVEIVATREGHDEMLKLTEIALECTDEVPENRPKMSEVLQKIEEIELKHREGN